MEETREQTIYYEQELLEAQVKELETIEAFCVDHKNASLPDDVFNAMVSMERLARERQRKALEAWEVLQNKLKPVCS